MKTKLILSTPSTIITTNTFLHLHKSIFTYAAEDPSTGTGGKLPKTWNNYCYQVINGIEVPTIQGLECIFLNIVKLIIPLAGLIVFFMIIVGAFQLITAGGEQKQLQKARGTITAAVLGLFTLVIVWFILLLIKHITGVDVTKFEIPKPTP